MTINLNKPETKAASQALAVAFQSDDTEAIEKAFNQFGDSIAEQIREDYEVLAESNDRAVMAQRGYRQLTAKEEGFYQKMTSALRSANPKQAFIDMLSEETEDVMPETILEDVFKYLAEERPLLQAVRFNYVGYSTKWIINDNSAPKGTWGKIDATITAEIEGALKVIDLTQSKYSCFTVIPLDILDMGPTFLDAFIRATLAEAIAYGIEDAIVNGTGENMPIGLTRNPNSSFSSGTGYEKKTAEKVDNFAPDAYGKLLAKLAKTEKGHTRNFGRVQLIVSPVDYLTKVMPATTALTADGMYVRDVFPYPTDVIQSTVVEEGKAVLAVLDDYTFAVGGSRNGVIEYDDSYKFLDDARTFRVVTHAAGRAFDNTSALVLDLSDIQPLYTVIDAVTATTSKTAVKTAAAK